MDNSDIRWHQRLNNFSKALSQLSKFFQKEQLNELEQQGLIQAFEYTYELAWNTLKDYFHNQGETEIHGSRDAFRLAFQRGVVPEGELWMEMIKSRTMTSHTYNESTAAKIVNAIQKNYYRAFQQLHIKMTELRQQELE